MKVGLLTGVVCLASQVILTSPMLNAAPQQKPKNSSATSSQGDQTTKQMSRLATRLLQHVDEARQAISSNKQAAANHVDQALADWNQLSSLAKSKNMGMVVPLYSEFDETSTLGPMIAARKGNQQPSKKSPANAYAPITVEQASGEFTFIGLDLDKAKNRLDAAKTALKNGNTQAASDSLNAVGSDLTIETEQANFPLLAARENLGIAESAVTDGHVKEAAAALKEASTDLNRFANGNPPRHADDARTLSKSIDSYSQTIANNHSGAAGKIDEWWHQVDNWFERPNHT